jgi:hypothetical protein
MSLTHVVRPAWNRSIRSWLPYLLLLGVYLTLRGYHSFDGDQAYRLPLLLHRRDPRLYADDPFVRSLDDFNPHRGALALLDAITRPIGLPAGLFLIFALTFLTTCRSVVRLAEAAWPSRRTRAAWIAVWLFFAAKAGNIGTNHLFEAMVLDRLVALALGWVAMAHAAIAPERGWWRASIAIAMATIVHPSIGLQLAMVLGASWLAWAALGRSSEVKVANALQGVAALGLAVLPGMALNLRHSATLVGDVPPELFRLLSVELQNPQHMLPHLWRKPQWLAWFSYLVLVGLQMAETAGGIPGLLRSDRPAGRRVPDSEAPRRRLRTVLVVISIGLAVAWYAIEILGVVSVTIFQPFRMGTVARGIAVILVSGRIGRLWAARGVLDRTRAAVLAAGFVGDWLLVVAATAELTVSTAQEVRRAAGRTCVPRLVPFLVFGGTLLAGWNFLAHHDTESGHVPLLVAVAVGIAGGLRIRRRDPAWPFLAGGEARADRRLVLGMAAAWVYPVLALLAALIPPGHPASRLSAVRGLVDRCRFYPTPLDDVERLALWCRDHTPRSARFIGPPGPKTFRLWSWRSLAFNRSGSPYHGAGLIDWFARFADHVNYHNAPEEFVRDYVAHRHDIEARYDALSDPERAALALRQGADHVIAPAPRDSGGRLNQGASPLELLHVEGRYAAYRVNPSALVHRQP